MTEQEREKLDVTLFVTGAVVVLVALIIGIIVFVKHHQSPNLANAKPACQLLTLADVQSVDNLQAASQESTSDSSAKLTKSKDVQQTACAYKTDMETVNIMSIQAFTDKGRTALTGTVNNFTNGGNGLTDASATNKVTDFGSSVTAYYNTALHYLLLQKGDFVIEMATITGNGDTTANTNNPATDQTDVLALAKIVLAKVPATAQ